MNDTNHRTVLLLVALAASIALVAVAPTALAALTSPPEVANSSTIQEGSAINVYDASSSNSTNLTIDTDNSDTIDTATVTATVDNRNLTVYESDEQASDYTFTADVDTDGDGTADHDQHNWEISYDELQDVPVAINDNTSIVFDVEFVDSNGNKGNITVNATVENGDNRSVLVLDQAAIDDSSAATLTASENVDEKGLGQYVPFVESENDTTYDAEATAVPTAGSNTTHYIYFKDSTAADEFDSAAETGVLSDSMNPFADPTAESGDRVYGAAAIHDGKAAPMFYGTANTDYADPGNDTVATYDATESRLKIEPGSDYSNSSSIDLRTSNQQPDELVAFDKIPSAMTQDLGFWDAQSLFGTQNAFSLMEFSVFAVPIVLVGARRRRRAAS